MSFIDPTITVGNIIEIASIVGGGLLVLVKLNSNVAFLTGEVSNMQTEIKKIGDVLTALAVTQNRLNNIETDIRELRNENPRGRHV